MRFYYSGEFLVYTVHQQWFRAPTERRPAMTLSDSLLLALAAFVAGAALALAYAVSAVAAFVAGAQVGASVGRVPTGVRTPASSSAATARTGSAATNPALPVMHPAGASVAPGVPRDLTDRELDASTMPLPAVGEDDDTLPSGGWRSIELDGDAGDSRDSRGSSGEGDPADECAGSWHPDRSGGGASGGLPPLLVADLDPYARMRPHGRAHGEPLTPWEAVYLCGRAEPIAEWTPVARGLRAVITILHLASDAGRPEACAHVVLTRAEAAVVAHILRRDFGLAATLARVGPRTHRVTAWRKPEPLESDAPAPVDVPPA